MTTPIRPAQATACAETDDSLPLRASDADREHAVRTLHAAVGRGLLTLEEGDERVAAAYRATHVRDLAPLLADLPADLPAEQPRRRPPGWRALAILFWLQLQTWLQSGARTVRGHHINPRLVIAVLGLLLIVAVILGLLGIDLD